MSYFVDYKNERFHDENLIKLVDYVTSNGKYAVITEGLILNLPDIGKYLSSYRKRDYDVHLEFEHAAICIETKVDSSENEYDDQPHYQTQRIHENYRQAYAKETYFRYMTYGASEFYVKRNEEGFFSTGPYSQNFKHIPLSNILTMIEKSRVLDEHGYPEIKEWNAYLKYEKAKRQNYLDMLNKVKDFRLLYLGDSGLTDWPNNRINICLPEILLFFYSMIAQAWNASPHKERIGGVSVYPVGRMGKVNDAVLNFSELWDNSTFTLNGLIESKNAIYFEFNEDFNLHLKCDANTETDKKIDAIYEFVQKHSAELSLAGKYNAIPERYKQGTYVLYEWDLRILENIDELMQIVSRVSEVIDNAMAVLK